MTTLIPETMTAAILTSLGSPLEICHCVKIPSLKDGQVLVRIFYAGLCHSQLQEARGGRGDDPWLPHMLGHEGTGEVVATGNGVTTVKVGQKVVLTWIKGSGHEAGGVQYTDTSGRIINAGGVTTFNEYAVVSENRLTPLADGTPLDIGVLYGCALPTGAGIVLNELKPQKGETVAVLGLGGIGISALMAIHACQPAMLIAVDIEPKKLKLAKELGATHTILASEVDATAEVKRLTNGTGVDCAVEAAGSARTIENAFEMIRRGGGRLIFASHPPADEKISLDPFELICGKKISGSWGGGANPDRDVPIFDKYYKDGAFNLNRMLSHKYALKDINQALDDLEARKIVRALIEISPEN